MKRSILIFMVIGVSIIFFGCSQDTFLDSELDQSDQVAAPELYQTDQAPASLAKPAPSLTSTITYNFVGALGIFDTEGRLLVWHGEIHGDIEGVILWWFDLTGSQETGLVKHYVSRWEIWSDYSLENENSEAVLLLAGDSEGTTATPPGKDGIWRGKGIVTEASEKFEDWIGRQTYEGGSVTWAIPGVLPVDGEGIFRIN